MSKKYCIVIADYKTSFTDPLKIQKGDKLKTEDRESDWPGWIWCITKDRKEGWVPQNYLDIDGDWGYALQDYNATELTVSLGEELIIEKQESGWIWVSDEEGNKGWIPLQNVKIIK